MDDTTVSAIVWLVAIVGIVAVFVSLARGKSDGTAAGPGPGAAGAVYDLLNQDKRNAIEIIVEERAAAKDPEDRDGNLPDLEDPSRPSTREK